MIYSVEMTPEAMGDIEAAYQWPADRTMHAPDWHNAALDAILSLESNPERCPIDDP